MKRYKFIMRLGLIIVIAFFVIISAHSQEDSVSAFSRPDIEERHENNPLKSMESELSFTYNEPMGIGRAFTPFILIGSHLFGKTERHITFNFEPEQPVYSLRQLQ